MSSRPATGLRFTAGSLPVDADGTHALVDVEPAPDGDGLMLDPRVQAELDEVVAERRRASDLARAGGPLTRTVLLSGPPGVGKSMTARWLAQRVELPLVTLDLAAVVSS
ncbi:MAG: AAA family ATPase, partial [Cellulomonadaceae bacterium]|nr:AAA family ATPase [Cellulomonadaceae bacterium]